jgi:hypothetical protein
VCFGFDGYDIAARTLGVLEFVENPECHRREEWVRLAWWELLHLGIENVRITVSKTITGAVQKMAWVRSSVAKSLAYVQRFMVKLQGNAAGFDRWLRDAVEQGAGDLRRADLARIGRDLVDYRAGLAGEGQTM